MKTTYCSILNNILCAHHLSFQNASEDYTLESFTDFLKLCIFFPFQSLHIFLLNHPCYKAEDNSRLSFSLTSFIQPLTVNLSNQFSLLIFYFCCLIIPLLEFFLLFYLFIYLFTYLFIYFCLFRAALEVYGISQARGQIRAAAAGLNHSHSNARSELHLQPTSQLMAMSDP